MLLHGDGRVAGWNRPSSISSAGSRSGATGARCRSPAAGQRSLLALLLLRRNEVVSSDRLIHELWGDAPPKTAQTALQGHVGQLRRLLGRERLVTRSPGYLLRVENRELDTERFEHLLRAGKDAEALELWRGQPLADCADVELARTERARLEELHLVALERRLEGDVGAGRSAEAVSELEALVGEHPLRERLPFLLMLALYRSGRQADALAVYQETRRALVDELGLEPSDDLRELHRRILVHDPALAAPTGVESEPAVVARGEERKTITVVYLDLAASAPASARLDAEAYDALIERLGGIGSAAIERHEGAVADASGNAVVGTFGLLQAREDDALRALRAAWEASEALAELELEARVGVATGEILARGETATLTGEVVEVAARMERQAEPGAVVLDDGTYGRCRDAVLVNALELRRDGMPDVVNAYVLRELIADAPPYRRAFETPLVGRERELADLRYAFEQVVERRAAALVTVLGAPGIGKTRLARELAASLGEGATVLEGRCLPYGEGITYWPLRELVLGASGADPLAGMTAALAGEDDAEAVTTQVASVVGLAEERATADVFWAVRRLVEAIARERPVVLLLEDLHWADQRFLDLLHYLAAYVREAPVLLVCLARPELVEGHPGWLEGEGGAGLVRLEPLSARESEALAGHFAHELSPEVRSRLVAAAEGNPLFLEQMLAHAAEGSLDVPPTVQALLAERIDRLSAGERATLEAAAIVGQEFWPEAVEELSPGELGPSLGRHLAALVGRDLVRPHASARFPGSFRFGHVLVRDAAYASIPKRRRAELHERFASWLATRFDELHELIGYHFEQAYGYRAELGYADEHARELGGRGAEHLGVAGRRAFARGDFVAASTLLAQALVLAPDGDARRPGLLVLLGRALWRLGRLPEARRSLEQAVELAAAGGDERDRTRAALWLSHVRWSLDEVFDDEEMERAARAAAERFEECSDHGAAREAWTVAHLAASYRTDFAASVEALERAIEHGRADGGVQAGLIPAAIKLHAHGPLPTSHGIARARELLAGGSLGKADEAFVLNYLAPILAMRGEFDAARESVRRAHAFWREAGTIAPEAADWLLEASMVELLAGDWPAAERALRSQCAQSEALGREPVLAYSAALLAGCLSEQGREDEALRWTERSEELARAHDPMPGVLWRSVRAGVLARRGEYAEAESLAREALAIAERGDSLWLQADASMDVGEALARSGRPREAAATVADALARYERKEHLVGAERAKHVLGELGLFSLDPVPLAAEAWPRTASNR